MGKYFSDNSISRLYPKKPTITGSKFVSFSIDNPDIPSNNEPPPPPCSLSEMPEENSENYKTRGTRLRKQSTKDYRVFTPK